MLRSPKRIGWPVSEAFSEIVDVRSPGEYMDDHIPGAVNLPVFSDSEREHVGTVFKQESPFLARKLGAKIACSNIAQHLDLYFAKKPQNYRPLVYCWRGGQRSASLATILSAIGWKTLVLENGYKGYRRSVLQGLRDQCPKLNLNVLNGFTGSGKTRLLNKLAELGAQVLDLEGLANHKGSVLGADPNQRQPSQKYFESLLWQKIAEFDTSRPVFAEAESRKVGNLHIPTPLWDNLTSSTVTLIDTPLDSRVSYLLEDYSYWPKDPELLCERLDVLRERYGHEKVDTWAKMIRSRNWPELVRALLTEHYDPMYSKSTRYPMPSRRVDLPAVSSTELQNAARLLHQA